MFRRKWPALPLSFRHKGGNAHGSTTSIVAAAGIIAPLVLAATIAWAGLPPLSFAPRVDVPLGPNSCVSGVTCSEGGIAVVAGDFDLDGDLDIATANSGSDDATVLLGDGAGGLTVSATLRAGAAPSAIAAGNLNDDAALDLVVANETDDNVSVLIGNGDGTFDDAVFVEMGSSPAGVVLADFDGDGALDVATADLFSESISVRLGKGNGTFGNIVSTTVVGGPIALAAGRLNADANVDLAVSLNAAASVAALLGNGDGAFTVGKSLAVNEGGQGVAVGDLDEDGSGDIVVATEFFDIVDVLLGNGDGTFSGSVGYSVGGFPESVAIGDYNGDGIADLATADSFGTVKFEGSVSVLLGNGDGTFQDAQAFETHIGPWGIVAADLNGDRLPDLVTASLDSDDVSVLVNTGTPPTATCVGDCNGDGTVAINELITGVNIAHTTTPLASCTKFDGNGDDRVTIEELVAGVRYALMGCRGQSYGGNPSETSATVSVDSATALPGESVQVAVRLDTAGDQVAGVQNDIEFPPDLALTVTVRPNGRPDCLVTGGIDKDGTSFSFVPSGCSPGTTCTGVRALVLALDNLAPIPDGVLYTCAVRVAPEATPGSTLPLGISNMLGSDPVGSVLAVNGSGGTVQVGGVTPTSTATQTSPGTPTDTPTRTPTPQRVSIEIGSVVGGPGTEVVIEVRLKTSGATVAATANDITFSNELFELDAARCQANPALGNSLLASLVNSTTLRAFVQGAPNGAPIPDGLLYTCALRVRPTTQPGTYPLRNSATRGFDSDGAEIPFVEAIDGEVLVTIVPQPASPTVTPTHTASTTPTETATESPPTTSTPAPSETSTTTPTSTLTSTAAATATVTAPPRCPGDCGRDGAVTISDLIRAVNIALGSLPVADCRAADGNEDGAVSISELIAAVNAALGGCAA